MKKIWIRCSSSLRRAMAMTLLESFSGAVISLFSWKKRLLCNHTKNEEYDRFVPPYTGIWFIPMHCGHSSHCLDPCGGRLPAHQRVNCSADRSGKLLRQNGWSTLIDELRHLNHFPLADAEKKRIIQSFKKKQGSSCRRAERKCSNFDPFTWCG